MSIFFRRSNWAYVPDAFATLYTSRREILFENDVSADVGDPFESEIPIDFQV